MQQVQDLQVPLRPCPICQGRQFQQITVTELERKVFLSACKHCGHEFINPLPLSSSEIEQYYQNAQEDFQHEYMDDPSRAPDFLVNQRFLRYFHPNGKKLLDFGCGKGQFCALAQQNGFQAFGYDLAHDLVQIGKNKGRSLYTGDFTRFAKKQGPFDFIHSDQVFEHLVDPVSVLEKLKSVLTPSGILCLSVPLRESFLHEYRFMEHLSYFSESSLKRLLTQAHFSILHCRKGLPFVHRYYRRLGRIPPPIWVHFWEKLTSLGGVYGWSLVIFARQKKE